MNPDSFDLLSRHLGAATSRRGLLKAFVAGVFGGAYLMAIPVPRTAEASCSGSLADGAGDCAHDSSDQVCCEGFICCSGQQCINQLTQCCDETSTFSGGCCPNGEIAVNAYTECCPTNRVCGPPCHSGAYCVNGYSTYGATCCAADHVCIPGTSDPLAFLSAQ